MMCFRRLGICCFPIWLVIATGCQHDSYGRKALGPLAISSQAPMHFVRLSPQPETAEVLDPGRFNIGYTNMMANYHIQSEELIMDLESKDEIFKLSAGLPFSSEISLSLETISATIVGLDRFTTKFHNAFDIPDEHRSDNEPDRTYISIPRKGIEFGEDDLEKPISRRITAQLRKNIFGSEDSAVVFTLGLLYSSDTARYEDQRETRDDVAVLAYGRVRLGEDSLHLSVGRIVPDPEPVGTLSVLPAWAYFVGYELITFSDQAILFQCQYIEAFLGEVDQLQNPSVEIIVGYKARMSQLAIEFGVMENVFWHRNTADWALYYGAEIKL